MLRLQSGVQNNEHIMDKTILKQLGLTGQEIEIYLHLADTKVRSVKQISDITAINRTTVYCYLTDLQNKGLVEWVIGNRGKKVRSTSPDNLNLYLSTQKNKLTSLAENLPPVISDLKLLKPNEKYATQVRYYEGAPGIEQMIWNSLKAREITRSYAALKRREYIDPKFEDEFEKEWAKRGLQDKIITNEDREEYIKNKLVSSYTQTLSIRIIPKKKFYISSDIIIYNNTLAIMSLEKDNLVGVEIESAEIVKTQKSIFDIIWEVAKRI